MALKDIQIPKADVTVGSGGSFAVRGLSTADIEHLVRQHGDELRKLFTDFMSSQKNPAAELSESGLKGMLADLAMKVPNVIYTTLDLAAEPVDDEERAILRKLPIPIQADALFKTISLTLNTEGDLGKGLETVVMALGGVNGLLVKLQQDKLS